MCILLLDIATVNRLQRIYHIQYVFILQDAHMGFVSEWIPCTFINVLASNHGIKLVNTCTSTCYSVVVTLVLYYLEGLTCILLY